MSISNTYTTLNAYIFGTRSGHAGIMCIAEPTSDAAEYVGLLTEADFWETVIGYLENEEAADAAEYLEEAKAAAAVSNSDEYNKYLENVAEHKAYQAECAEYTVI